MNPQLHEIGGRTAIGGHEFLWKPRVHYSWVHEHGAFLGDLCLICKRLITAGTAKAKHARQHLREGRAVKVGTGTKADPFKYLLQ